MFKILLFKSTKITKSTKDSLEVRYRLTISQPIHWIVSTEGSSLPLSTSQFQTLPTLDCKAIVA